MMKLSEIKCLNKCGNLSQPGSVFCEDCMIGYNVGNFHE